MAAPRSSPYTGRSAARRPGLVIAGRGRAFALGQDRALGAVGQRCPGQIGLARLVALFRRRDVDSVLQPALPASRHARCFSLAIIDDPAALDAEGLVLGP